MFGPPSAPGATRALGIIVSVGLIALGSGCAMTIGTIHAATGDWPTSSSQTSKAWVGGEPRRSLTVEAHLSTPPRALCDQHHWEPEAHVTSLDYGLDGGSRFALGFIGLAEMAALIPLLADDDPGAGAIVALGALALDGLATFIMAFAIPDTERTRSWNEGPSEWTTKDCPGEVAFEARGRVLPVYSDGSLAAGDAEYLMEVVLSGEPVFGLRNGDDLRRVEVPPEVACDWATHLNHPAQRRYCPQQPVFVPVPVVPGRPVRPQPIR